MSSLCDRLRIADTHLCVILCLCVLVTTVAANDRPVGPTARAVLRDRTSKTIRFVPTTKHWSEYGPFRAFNVSIRDVKRIDLAPRTFDWNAQRHVRIVTLWTGEFFAPREYALIGENNGYHGVTRFGIPMPVQRLQFPMLQYTRRRELTPLSLIASLRSPRQASDLMSMPYTVVRTDADGKEESRRDLKPELDWVFHPVPDSLVPGGHATFTLPESATRTMATIEIGGHALSKIDYVQLLLQDASGRDGQIQIEPKVRGDGGTVYDLTSDCGMPAKRIEVTSTWLKVWNDENLTVSIGGQLLGMVPRWRGRLKSIRVFSHPLAKGRGVFLNPVRLRVGRPASGSQTRLTPVGDADCIAFANGDELYGSMPEEFSGAGALEVPRGCDMVRLKSIAGPVHVPWPDIAEVRFRHSPLPIAPSTEMAAPHRRYSGPGWISRLTLAPEISCARFGEPHGGWLRGVVLAAHDRGLNVDHPLMSHLMLPWHMLQRIEPLAYGTIRMIDTGPRHLGRSIREDFSSPEPTGTEWKVDWFQSEKLVRPLYLSADVAALNPSGPDALAATPFLNDVREGFLATRVEINGELIGTLNDQVSTPIDASSPRRVRMRIPRYLVKTGVNALVFRQTPARDDPAIFDDCEIRAIALEEDYPLESDTQQK